tara:strand:- start:751 stop:1143 length:393 start_codon:yes stop_codon:yes gene_type:complete
MTAADLAAELCNAAEHGIGYWCSAVRVHSYPEGMTEDNFRYDNGEESGWPNNPLNLPDYGAVPALGGVLEYEAIDSEESFLLDWDKVQSGLEAMDQNDPNELHTLLEGGGDAVTSDRFVQFCLFGEVIYG